MADVNVLIQDLRTGDYYSRSSAARALGELGCADAADALIEALKDEDDWVQEYAAEALGKIRCGKAVGPLGELLKSENYKVRTAAVDALGAIGGNEARLLLEPLNDDPDSWVRSAVANALQRLSAEEPEAAARDAESPARPEPLDSDYPPGPIEGEVVPQPGAESIPTTPATAKKIPRTPEETVELITAGTSIKYKETSAGFVLRVPVGNGRHQKVRLNYGSTDEDGSPIIQLFTIIGPAHEKYYRWALKLNPSFSYGAIGLVKIDGKEFLAIIDTVLEESYDEKVLEKSLWTLARMGDALERKLIHKDLW